MLALTAANLKMLARNRQTTFWALFFPLILVVAFGLFDFTAFSVANLGVVDQAGNPASQQLSADLAATSGLRLKDAPEDPAAARRLVAAGELDYLLIIPPEFAAADSPQTPAAVPVPVTLAFNANNPERNRLAQNIVRRRAAQITLGQESPEPPKTLIAEEISTRRVAYFDLALLGLVGMGIMTNAIISIAARISSYRNLAILKRMLVTPLPIWKFFAAEVIAQLVLALIQAAVILGVGVFVFQAQLTGNLLNLLPVIILGSVVFLNLGFIISAWANSPASASGMGNAIAFPMTFFAGVFFPTSALPWLLPYAADLLPLAPMLSALRDIAIYEASLWQVWPQLAILTGWVAATALIAVRVFRFN